MNAPDPTRVINADRRFADRRLHSRMLGPAIVISVLFHAALLFLVTFRGPTADELPPPPPRLVRVVEAMQALDITLVTVAAPAVDVQVRREPERAVAVPAVPLPATPQLAPTAAAPPRGADDPSIDRLRYRNDPRQNVWRRSEPPTASPDEMMRERVASQLGAYNDSVAAEAAARARATDWTVKDGEGGRWGVSPGAIHLGAVTLPLPFTFSTPPGRRDEVAGRLTTWTEIQQQATLVEGREIIKDRVKAMEQRKAAERAARQGGSTTGGSTTGSSRPGGGS